MAKIFLVDTENVNIRALKGANYLDENDLIILFTTNKTIVHNFHENLIKTIETKATIKNIHIESGGKNCLDFQLVSCLGLVIGTNNKKNMEYYINLGRPSIASIGNVVFTTIPKEKQN